LKVIDLIRTDLGLYASLIIWLFVSTLFTPFAYVVIPIVFILVHKEKYFEVIITLLLVLILSDNSNLTLSWVKSFKTIFMLSLGIAYLFKLNEKRYSGVLIKYLIPFFIVSIICIIYSPIPLESIQKTFSYFLVFLIVPVFTLEVIKNEGAQVLFRIVTFGFLILLISYMVGFFGNINQEEVAHRGRLSGLFGNPNGLGIFIVNVSCLLVAVKAVYGKFGGRYFYILAVIFSFYLTMKTGSRGALMALSGLFICLVLFKFSNWIGLLFIIFFITLYEYIADFMINVLVAVGLQEELRLDKIEEGSGRLIVWAFAWENIQDSFYVGKGFGYDRYLTRANYILLSRKGHEGGVHNSYLMIWLNTGLIGLLAWLRAIILITVASSKITRVAWPILIAVLLSAFFEGWLVASLNPYTSVFLITLTVMISPKFIEAEENELKVEPTPAKE
jgi:O-antigen ligase